MAKTVSFYYTINSAYSLSENESILCTLNVSSITTKCHTLHWNNDDSVTSF